MMSSILYIILTIIVVMIIMLAIGVRRMERRLDKKIEEVRQMSSEAKGNEGGEFRMNQSSSSLQVKILKVLKEHEEASPSSTSELFSMDEFRQKFYPGLRGFGRQLRELESRGYIRSLMREPDQEFGYYEIEDLGKKYLEDLHGNKS